MHPKDALKSTSTICDKTSHEQCQWLKEILNNPPENVK